MITIQLNNLDIADAHVAKKMGEFFISLANDLEAEPTSFNFEDKAEAMPMQVSSFGMPIPEPCTGGKVEDNLPPEVHPKQSVNPDFSKASEDYDPASGIFTAPVDGFYAFSSKTPPAFVPKSGLIDMDDYIKSTKKSKKLKKPKQQELPLAVPSASALGQSKEWVNDPTTPPVVEHAAPMETFSDLMRNVVKLITEQKITAEKISEICNSLQISDLTGLSKFPNLIPAFNIKIAEVLKNV